VRDQFRGFYPPKTEELSGLWTEGLVVFDANTLLNLYRYTDQTAAEFLATLTSIQDRVWIPHQAGLEFHRRRLDVMDQQMKAYESIVGAIEGAKKTVAGEVMRFKRHSFLNADRLVAEYQVAISPMLETLREARAKHLDVAPSSPLLDPLLDTVTEIFAGRVGEAFSAVELEAIYGEGRERYAGEIPPGYKDQNKGEPGCFGDLVIWKEILRKGGELQRPTIFVTDDAKEDWWRIVRGQTIGPRVELVDEYFNASKARIHFYGPEQFLRFAKERFSAVVSDESIGEVEAVSRSDSDDHVRSIIMARKDELLHRRDATERMLHRSEMTQREDEEYGNTDRTVALLESELSEFRKMYTVLMAREEEFRSAGVEAVTPEEHAIMGRNMEEIAEAKKAIGARMEWLDREHARSDQERRGRRMRPRAESPDRYRSRLHKIDRDLSEVDQALRELGAQDI
jgi:hypothetical protein